MSRAVHNPVVRLQLQLLLLLLLLLPLLLPLLLLLLWAVLRKVFLVGALATWEDCHRCTLW